MYLKKIGKLFTSKFVRTGPLVLWKKHLPGRGLTNVEKHWSTWCTTCWKICQQMVQRRNKWFDANLKTSLWNTEIMVKVLFQLQTSCTDIIQKLSYYAITYVRQDAHDCGIVVRNARASPAASWNVNSVNFQTNREASLDPDHLQNTLGFSLFS